MLPIKIHRLYVIQLWALPAVWFASYFDGLDIFLSAIFLLLIIIESIIIKSEGMFSGLMTILFWQLPGILLALFIITGLAPFMPGGEYYIFALEIWYTPVIPLVSLLSVPFLPNPIYYNILLLTPIMMSGYYMLGFLYSNGSTTKRFLNSIRAAKLKGSCAPRSNSDSHSSPYNNKKTRW